MNEAIPGIIPEGMELKGPVKPAPWAPMYHKGKVLQYICVKGEPLRFDTLGQVPKKVLRRLEKAWRSIHPVSKAPQFAYPRITSKYSVIALQGWLAEKMAVAS